MAARISESTVDCKAVTFAVVAPVTPLPTYAASITATRAPPRLSSSAVVMPVMPPPITATSNSPSGAGGERGVVGSPSSQRDCRAVVVGAIGPHYPIGRRDRRPPHYA